MPMVRGSIMLVMLAVATAAKAADRLPAYTGDPKETSVSGLSSGAFMAVQYQIAFSALVKGAGIVAGGPYYCAAGNVLNTGICMGQVAGKTPVPALMVAAARNFQKAGRIDGLERVTQHRVYVYSGTQDQVVKPPAVEALAQFYRLLGLGDGALKVVNTVPSGHAMITPDFGSECGSNAAPFISHCAVGGAGYDQAGEILGHIYGALKAPAATVSGRIVTFSQEEFAKGARMADEGYVYVPASCASGTPCRVHIAFHGCSQSAKSVDDRFYAHAGYNRWADTNQLIVLYPQVDRSLLNPQGCWDWFGYTGRDYATKTGAQMAAVKTMADRLLGVP